MRKDPRFPNLFILDHPLIQHKLTHMRDKTTSTRTFRELLREIILLMGYEVTRNLPLTTRTIETPLVRMEAPVIAGKKLAVVPILRAGVGMAEGLLELIPSARVGSGGRRASSAGAAAHGPRALSPAAVSKPPCRGTPRRRSASRGPHW
jgi:uracil phosphoribosyltransferase